MSENGKAISIRKIHKSHDGSGWANDPDFTVTCIGCVEITTPAPTTVTIPDGAIPCVPGFYEAGYYFPEQECDGSAQVGFNPSEGKCNNSMRELTE